MLDAVFSAAAHVIEESVYQQAYAAVPIETRGIVVEYEPGVGEITMWVATQAPHEHRAFCARLLGIPEHRVRAIARDTGGGFGQKILVQREEMCRHARRHEAAGGAEVDRGPAREPDGGRAGPATSTAPSAWPSTTTA